MNIVFTILVSLVVIASILLTIAVLLQNGKGDSMASNFVAGNQTFGVRQTANILEKVTWGHLRQHLHSRLIPRTLQRRSNNLTR